VLSGYAFLLGYQCHCGVGYDIPKPTIRLGIKPGKGENNVLLGFVRVVGEPSSSTKPSWSFSILITLIINILNVHIGLKFEEETSKMLLLEHGFVWC